MVAILITVCLIGDPNTCRDYKITLVPGVTLAQCLMTAVVPTYRCWAVPDSHRIPSYDAHPATGQKGKPSATAV